MMDSNTALHRAVVRLQGWRSASTSSLAKRVEAINKLKEYMNPIDVAIMNYMMEPMMMHIAARSKKL